MSDCIFPIYTFICLSVTSPLILGPSLNALETLALFVFLMSRDCCVAFPHDATGLSAVLIVFLPDHTFTIFGHDL